MHQRLKVLPVSGQRGGPHQPVNLHVGLARVQRQAKRVLLGQIIGDLGLGNLGVKDVPAQHAVPHQIVLLTPGAGTVERQAVVVAVIGHALPLDGHATGHLLIAARGICLA